MVNDQEGEVVEVRTVIQLLDNMAATVEAGLIASGTDPAIAEMFACLRFHIMHPWGIATVLYNSKPRTAIVRGDGNGGVLIFAIITEPGDDIKAVNGTPIDAHGHLPMSALEIAKTKH